MLDSSPEKGGTFLHHGFMSKIGCWENGWELPGAYFKVDVWVSREAFLVGPEAVGMKESELMFGMKGSKIWDWGQDGLKKWDGLASGIREASYWPEKVLCWWPRPPADRASCTGSHLNIDFRYFQWEISGCCVMRWKTSWQANKSVDCHAQNYLLKQDISDAYIRLYIFFQFLIHDSGKYLPLSPTPSEMACQGSIPIFLSDSRYGCHQSLFF